MSFSSTLVPSLLLDGASQTSGATQGNGASMVITASITHPYAYSPPTNKWADITNNQSLRVTATANAVFVIANGWGQTGRGLIERHRRLAQEANRANPTGSASEPVMGESLEIQAFAWLAETARTQQIVDALSGNTTTYHHALGIVGAKPSGSNVTPFVDLPVNLFSFIQTDNRSA